MTVSCTVHNILLIAKCVHHQITGLVDKCEKVMHHAQTYHMQWPDQLSQVKEKAQHNDVSHESKNACKKNVMHNSQRKHTASPRQPPLRNVQCE